MTLSQLRVEEAGSRVDARRRFGMRFSSMHLLIGIVVILAFILNLLALRDRSATVSVAIVDVDLSPGTSLSSSDLRWAPLAADFDGAHSLLREAEVHLFEGWVINRPVTEGSPLTLSALSEPGSGAGVRTMSIPVSVSNANGGDLAAGDSVDVISIVDGSASYVATDLEIVSVADPRSQGVATTSGFFVVAVVTPEAALEIAEAIDRGSLELIRSTGASPLSGDPNDP